MQVKKTIHQFLSGVLTLALTTPVTWGNDYPLDGAAQGAVPELDCVIEPSDIVDVGSAVPGVVESIMADRSDLVKSGAVIATLESSVEQAALELAQVRALLNTAIDLRREAASFGYRTLKRKQELKQKSVIALQDIDQVKSETRIARLQVKQEQENKRIAELEHQRARAILERRTLRSPVDGVVMDRFKSVGEYIEDDPVLRLARLDPLHVEVVVPVEYLGLIKPGMQAEVTAVVPGADTHRAAVERVDLVADAASGTYGVRLILPNPNYGIAAGLRCRLAFLPAEDTAQISSTDSAEDTGVDEGVTAPMATEDWASVPVRGLEKTEIAPARPMENGSPDRVQVPRESMLGDTCYTVGPIAKKPLALKLSERVKAWAGESALREQTVAQSTDYVVLTARQPDRAHNQQLIGRLQTAGIRDLHLFEQGPYRNRVSLGLYNTKRFAVERQNQLSAKGFETEIERRNRPETRYWLDVTLKNGAAFPDQIDEIGNAFKPALSFEPVACSSQLVQR